MARERHLEGEGGDEGDARDETNFSDVELDDDGNPIDDEGEEEEEEEGEEEGDDGEDRGDNVLDDDDEGNPDLDALSAVAGDDMPTVPRARLNEILAENRRLRGVIEQVATTGGGRGEQTQQRQQEQAPAFDLKAKLKERAEAILEGDTDRIVALDEEIENFRNTTVRREGEQAGRTAASAAYQKERMDEIVSAAFSRYPFLNDANADFSEEALRDVMMYKNRFMEEGDSPANALKKAVNRVCPYYAEELYPERGKGGGKKLAKGAKGDGDGARDPNSRDPRKIQRNARAGNRVPPNLGRAGTGNAAGRRDIADRGARDIPGREYHDMTEAEKKRLRGDFVSQ